MLVTFVVHTLLWERRRKEERERGSECIKVRERKKERKRATVNSLCAANIKAKKKLIGQWITFFLYPLPSRFDFIHTRTHVCHFLVGIESINNSHEFNRCDRCFAVFRLIWIKSRIQRAYEFNTQTHAKHHRSTTKREKEEEKRRQKGLSDPIYQY